jgi:hypothetical protein
MKTEYNVMYVRANMATSTGLPDDFNIKLNELAADGWELDKVVPKTRGGIFLFGIGRIEQTVGYLVFLKRQI